MKITHFGRAEHRLLSQAITQALKAVGDEYGVELSAGGGQIGGAAGRVHVNVTVRDTASGVSGAKAAWDAYCGHYGLRPDDFEATFVSNGRLFKITGISPTRPKYPIDAIRVGDNRAFKFPASTVNAKLPMKRAA